MPKPPRSVPVRDIVTTALEVLAVAALTASGWLLLGLAGALVVVGVFALALSHRLVGRP